MLPMVRLRKSSVVTLPDGGATLPEPGRRVQLSPLDAFWVALPPVRRVFLYCSLLPFTDVVGALRSSLQRVLPAFHPFAGELTYSPDSQALCIVLQKGKGVAFLEAETDLDFDSLVEEEYDEDAFRQLAPDIRRVELPMPVMAVQVTEFVGGGMALGVAVHHTVADGRGLWHFIEMWSATAASVKVWAGPEPLHDRSLVRFDGEDELAKLFLQQRAPDIPRVAPKQDGVEERERPLSRLTFTFDASAVRRHKQRFATNTSTTPSTFATIAAHGWVSIARARGLVDDSPVFAAFLADCRALMSPPVPGAYVGNCVAVCTASLTGLDLAQPDGPDMALWAIQEAVAHVKRDPLGDRARWHTMFAAIPPGRAVMVAGSPWFPAYGVDFGFGRPARVELASMNYDGEMVLVAGRDPGSVQASVAIAADKMPAFRGMFESEFDHTRSVPVPESD